MLSRVGLFSPRYICTVSNGSAVVSSGSLSLVGLYSVLPSVPGPVFCVGRIRPKWVVTVLKEGQYCL